MSRLACALATVVLVACAAPSPPPQDPRATACAALAPGESGAAAARRLGGASSTIALGADVHYVFSTTAPGCACAVGLDGERVRRARYVCSGAVAPAR